MSIPSSNKNGGPYVHVLASKGKGKGAGKDDGGKGSRSQSRDAGQRNSNQITIKLRQRSKSPGGTSWTSARANSNGSNKSHRSVGGGRDAKGVRRKPLGGYYCKQFMSTGTCPNPNTCKAGHYQNMQQWKDKKEHDRSMSAMSAYKREYNKTTKKTLKKQETT